MSLSVTASRRFLNHRQEIFWIDMKALPYKCTGDVSLTFLTSLRFLETELMANLPMVDFSTEKSQLVQMCDICCNWTCVLIFSKSQQLVACSYCIASSFSIPKCCAARIVDTGGVPMQQLTCWHGFQSQEWILFKKIFNFYIRIPVDVIQPTLLKDIEVVNSHI